jgi:glycerol-3-phosphate dehydrogenase
MQENILINCTGLGAAKLFGGDQDLRPIRGQLVILPNNNPAQFNYFFSGGCDDDVAYMFARQNDIVIGVTVNRNENEPRDFFDAADPNDKKICDRLFDNARLVFGGKPDDCVAPPTPA